MNREEFASSCFRFLNQFVPFDDANVFVAGGFFQRYYHYRVNQIGCPPNETDIDVYVNGATPGPGQIFTVFGYRVNQIDNEFDRVFSMYQERGYIASNRRRHYAKLEIPEHLYIPPGFTHIDLIGFHNPQSVDFIHKFDFNICKFAMDRNSLHCHPDHYNDMVNKRLTVTDEDLEVLNVSERNNQILRLVKYLKQGYTIDGRNSVKLLQLIRNAADENENDTYPVF